MDEYMLSWKKQQHNIDCYTFTLPACTKHDDLGYRIEFSCL